MNISKVVDLLFGTGILLFCLTPAEAGTTYTYTGNAFTICDGSLMANCTSGSLMGFFTVDLSGAALNDLNAQVFPSSFDFSAFDDHVTEATPAFFLRYFRISTDASGDITAWDIELESFSAFIQSFGDPALEFDYYGENAGGGFAVGDAYSSISGTWVRSEQSVPEPLTVSLFGAGLTGTVAMRRRKAKRT